MIAASEDEEFDYHSILCKGNLVESEAFPCLTYDKITRKLKVQLSSPEGLQVFDYIYIQQEIRSKSRLPLQRWSHIILKYNGKLELWINGIFDSSLPFKQGFTSNKKPLVFGRLNSEVGEGIRM
jgi:hypothetical protein